MRTANNPQDPLLYDTEMPLVKMFHPLGLTLKISTNAPEILDAAEESWGMFEERLQLPLLEMRLGVLDVKWRARFRPPFITGQRGITTQVVDERNFVTTNCDAGFSYGWVTKAVAADRAFLRYYFIEGGLWAMATPRYLTPIHAACVNYRGSGVLLCGDSGAGKSTLAYACARRGWSFMTDDGSNLVRDHIGNTVIGNPFQIRLRPPAKDLFPELSGLPVGRRLTGKLSIELATSKRSDIQKITESAADFIVFLNRRQGPAELAPYSEETALKWFERSICYASHEIRAAQRASLRRLLGANVFELRYSELDDAINRLESMICDSDRRPDVAAMAAETELNV
ncbi:MAG TPA: hypothetical protein VIY69_13180 [Candidatus Acidoferrales bacterium]